MFRMYFAHPEVSGAARLECRKCWPPKEKHDAGGRWHG